MTPCIDSHLHFDSFVEDGTVPELLDAAKAVGVHQMVAIGGSVDANRTAIHVARGNPGMVFATAGFDRDEAGKPFDRELLSDQLANPLVVGIGETGLDYHYSADTRVEQMALFDSMLECAAEFSKPVVIHSRDADNDTLDLLKNYVKAWKPDHRPPAVLHCFTGNQGFADALLELGLVISFSGIVTFKNARDLQAVAKRVPLNRMLIETDSPYLAPVPHRGKKNQPAFVVQVAECIGELRDMDVHEIKSVTAENTRLLFQLPSI